MKHKKSQVIQLIQNMDKSCMPWITVSAVLEALVSYWNVILTAILVELLADPTDFQRIMRTVCMVLSVYVIVKVLVIYTKKVSANHIDTVLEEYKKRKIIKVFQIKFSEMETAEFQRMMQSVQYNDDTFGAMSSYINEVKRFIQNIIQIGYACGFLIWMGIHITQTGKTLEFICMVAAVGVFIWLLCKLLVRIQNHIDQKMPELMNRIVDVNKLSMILFQEVIQNYHCGKDIRLFGIDRLIEKENHKMLKEYAPHLKQLNTFVQLTGMVGSIGSVLLAGIAYLFFSIYGEQWGLSVGIIISFAGAMTLLAEALITLTFQAGNIRLWETRMSDSLKLLSMDEEIHYERRIEQDDIDMIRLNDIHFKYPDSDKEILKGISLNIHRGEKIAVVGENGSGKSTLMKVLTGLYSPDQGEIYLDEKRVQEASCEAYRKYFSTVYQDFFIYAFDVAENVALDEEYRKEDVARQLERVNLYERVKKMPQGIHTFLYQYFVEEGQEISGGEAQKLAIARALYQDAPVVVLDEPTSALDAQAEYEIYTDFQKLIKNKTAVLVSHRLSSCQFCDRILVMEDGKIVQDGPHRELVKDQNGLYYRLWKAQTQYYTDEAVEAKPNTASLEPAAES